MRLPVRHAGPPDSANGGVTAGRLAAYLAGLGGDVAAQVTLRRPPPLATDLRVDVGLEGVRLLDGDVLVAEAVRGAVDVDPPAPVGVEAARGAAAQYDGRTAHPFPGCFVCGTDREPPDGLGLRPGPVGERHVAAAWTPADDDPAMVWAALDCPGGWASGVAGRPMVLGRMALRSIAPVEPGHPHVVQGWVTGEDGRKMFTGTCLYDDAGRLLALAQATWLVVDPDRVGLSRTASVPPPDPRRPPRP